MASSLYPAHSLFICIGPSPISKLTKIAATSMVVYSCVCVGAGGRGELLGGALSEWYHSHRGEHHCYHCLCHAGNTQHIAIHTAHYSSLQRVHIGDTEVLTALLTKPSSLQFTEYSTYTKYQIRDGGFISIKLTLREGFKKKNVFLSTFCG